MTSNQKLSARSLPRDQTLDSLRGIAAVLVVLFHLTMESKLPDYGLHLGMTGVDLFFIISGYVIFMTLSKTKTAKEFITNRFIRLYPTYWTCVSITFLVVALYVIRHTGLTQGLLGRYAGNMTMFQHYLRIESLDGSYWTMIVEMVFYLTMLLIYSANQLRNIELIGGLLTLSCALTFTVGLRYFPSFYREVNFYYPLLNHLPLFYAGIIFYLIKNQRATVKRYLIIGLCLVASFFVFDNLGRYVYINHVEHIAMLCVYYSLFVLYVNNKLTWLKGRLLTFLGSISYALYLIHQKICIAYLQPFLAHKVGNYPWLNVGIMLLVAIGLATAITYGVEKPAIRFLKRKSSRISAHQAVSVYVTEN